MHSQEAETVSELVLDLFSATGDGMHVEASRLAADGRRDLLLTFRQDERDVMQVLLHLPGGDLTLPLAELKRVIAYAEQEVHNETFYGEPASVSLTL